MVKIAKTTGQRKQPGPAAERVSKSNPRREAAKQRLCEPAVAAGENTVRAKAFTNPRPQMPRQRDWRYRDTFNLQEQGGDKSPVEPLHREPTQAEIEPQSQPAENKSPPQRSALARQASQYVSEDTDEQDEENERFIETGEHIDEYDDRDMEGVDKLRFVKEESEPPEEEVVKMRDFMRLLRKDGGVFVSKRLRGIVNTGDAAIVLGQIMYWFDSAKGTGRTRAAIWRDDRNWIFKTHAELGRETGIKPRQVRDCLKFLTAKGFIERRYHRADGMRTTYLSLDHDKVHNAMQEIEQKRRENAGATCFVQ